MTTITFWLVLIIATPKSDAPRMMHVGNLATLDQCNAAANNFTRTTPGDLGRILTVDAVCVQANGPECSHRD